MIYRKDIDGLRALAVLPVIFFHAGFGFFSGGFVGVDVFFVISGYLITTIIVSEINRGDFSFLRFYERRARRILPALIFVIIFSIPFAFYVLYPQDFISFSKSLVSISLFSSNFFFWSERGYFGEISDLKPFIHSWSLSVEEQYYFIFPMFLVFFRKKNSRNILLFLLFSTSVVLCIWLTPVHQDSAFFLLPTRFWELLVGSFVGIYLAQDLPKSKFISNCAGNFFGIVGLGMIFYAILFYDSETPFPGYHALVPVIGSALVIMFSSEVNFLGRILGFGFFVFIGNLSYSAYLWHQPIFAFARHSGILLSQVDYVFLIFFSLIVSYFSWRYVERPFRAGRFSGFFVFSFSIGGLVLISFLGFLGVFNRGFMNRYSADDVRVLSGFVEPGTYVAERFDELKLAPFLNGPVRKKKVLVIGDSYAKDIVNAVYESTLIDFVQISTYQINSECGNLYLKEDFSAEIEVGKIRRCRVMGWYENERLQQVIRDADAIWLASSWMMWVAEKVPLSVSNLKRDFGKPVIVFGTKNFGDINLKRLLAVPVDKRAVFLNPISLKALRVQSFMRNRSEGMEFVDVGAMLCGTDVRRCRVFDLEGNPLTFDGGHLTKSGAVFLGHLLDSDPRFLAYVY